MRKKLPWIIALVLAVGTAGLLAGSYIGRQLERPAPLQKPDLGAKLTSGATVPDETLQFPDGEPVQLSDLTDGLKTIVVFLSPECQACVDLARDWTDVFSTTDAQVISIIEDISGLPAYLEKWPISGMVLVDPARRLGSALGLAGLPTFLGLDENRKIAFAEIGYSEDERERLTSLVEQL